MPVSSLSESQRRLAAATIYSEPLKSWETRALRLEPLRRDQDEGDVVEVHLETAVIPHLEGLGLVGSGEVVLYEALSYTWESPVLSNTVRCNGLDFSITANLHAALVHLRSSDVHRWLWVDALCINQYDEAEKERQVRNMFHIFRKASTVLVWLGLAGPATCLGAEIVNVYDAIWQEERSLPYGFCEAVEMVLRWRARDNSDTNIYVDEFLNDLQQSRLSGDETAGADTLGLVSMALEGIAEILGRAWIRRTWIIQEIAAATNVKFQCGRSVLSYDGFFEVIPWVGSLLWHTRSIILAGEDLTVSERLRPPPLYGSDDKIFPTDNNGIRDDGPASFRESLPFTELLSELRLLVNDPGRVGGRRTQTELVLMFLVETISRGFDVSIAVDRVYSLMAMADAISSASWGLTHSKRTPSSPQQLPVDYSVGLQAAVLRLLKIRMNEVKYFYLVVECLFAFPETWEHYEYDDREDLATKPILFSMCSAYSSPPSWLSLLEFDAYHFDRYFWKVRRTQRKTMHTGEYWEYTEQDVMEPDTLVMRGKALGRIVVDSEGQPSRTWVALPCPLGQEFETCHRDQKPVRALDQGCPHERPAAGDGANSDETEIEGEREEPIEQQTALNQIGTGSCNDSSTAKVTLWSWKFPLHARDGDVIVIFSAGICALLRPLQGGRYTLVEKDLRVAVDSSVRLNRDPENKFIYKYRKDLDIFVLI